MALLICSDVLSREEKNIFKERAILELNILSKKNNESMANPYVVLSDSQRKIFANTKSEIEKTIALVEEIL